MQRRPPPRRSRGAGSALLTGVAVGTVLVLIVATSFAGPFRLSVSPARSGSLSQLGCAAGQCVNVTIQFTGASSLDPSTFRISVLPYNGTAVVNQTPGAALNLAYFPASEPHWVGNLGGGNYTQSFIGDIVNPGGLLVGQGGPSSISSGAVLCLKGNSTGPTQEYTLAFSDRGVDVSIPFAVA
jgi:hypothetical protein